MQCAPSNLHKHQDFTCYTIKDLIEIAKAFNSYIQTKSVCSREKCALKKVIDINQSKKQLWLSISDRMQAICKNEYCWLDHEFIDQVPDKTLKDKIRYFTFKPKMTKRQHTWLNSSDINQVMQQFQALNVKFKFLGALPSDFYTQTHVNFKQALDYDLVGIIFNLDKHNQPGSHWVAFLLDNVKKTIEYFDSVGNPPNKSISKFIVLLSKHLPSKYVYLENKHIHQNKDSECGVYSMYYIIKRLAGKSFEKISSTIIRDDQMNKFRQVVFRQRS